MHVGLSVSCTNQHQHLNVLCRSPLHAVTDAGHAPNRATWRPQLKLQMFALPFPGCLTTSRVSVPRHLASCTVSKYRKVSLAEKEATLKRFIAVLSVRPKWMCSIAVLRDDLISSSLSMRPGAAVLEPSTCWLNLSDWCIHTALPLLCAVKSSMVTGFLDNSPFLQWSTCALSRRLRGVEQPVALLRKDGLYPPSQTVRTFSFVSFSFAAVCALMRSLLKSCIIRSKFPPEPGV